MGRNIINNTKNLVWTLNEYKHCNINTMFVFRRVKMKGSMHERLNKAIQYKNSMIAHSGSKCNIFRLKNWIPCKLIKECTDDGRYMKVSLSHLA